MSPYAVYIGVAVRGIPLGPVPGATVGGGSFSRAAMLRFGPETHKDATAHVRHARKNGNQPIEEFRP